MLTDLKYSVRLLKKTPAFTGITLLVIVLGLSLYLASYSLVETFFREPLPFPDGERYVTLKSIDLNTNADNGRNVYDTYFYHRLKATTDSYSLLGAFSNASLVLSDGDYASTYEGSYVEAELFAAFSVDPVLGRSLDQDDQVPGSAPVVVISHGLWQEYYAGNADVVGRVSEINGQAHTIIGVMPESFNFPIQQHLWLPLSLSNSSQPGEGRLLSLVGILGDSIDLSQADAELKDLVDQLGTEFPEIYANRSGLVAPFAAIYSPSNFPMPLIMSAISVVILGLAIVNLSSLLFMRANARQQELAIRSSVGANGWQLANHVLIESFTICLFGFLLSLLVSSLMLSILHTVMVNSVDVTPFWMQSGLDSRGITNGAICALVIWLASGLVVAYKVYRGQPGAILGSANKGADPSSTNKTTSTVVVIEVTLSCFLLILCGVFVNMMARWTNADYGAGTQNLIIGEIDLTHPDYNENATAQLTYIRNLINEVRQISGVSAATITTQPSYALGLPGTYDLDDRDLARNQQLPPQTTYWVDHSYFQTVGLNVLVGREFDEGDTSESENVVIVDETFAQQMWPDQTVIGKRVMSLAGDQQQWLTVVGIVPTVRTVDGVLVAQELPRFYRPIAQQVQSSFFLVARHQPDLDVNSLRTQINRAAGRVDRNIPINEINTLEKTISLRFGATPVFEQIFVEFSLGTLALACIGIYGVIGRSISQRTQEVGIQRALGSTDFRIIFRFMKNGFYFLVAGLVLGAMPAYLLINGSFSNFGFLIDLLDLPVITLLVIIIMAVLVTAACYLPAKRAVAMEPGDALRYE